MKPLLLTLLMIPAFVSASAQTGTDNVLALPADNANASTETLDLEIKNLYDNWYLQRYAVLDTMTVRPVDGSVADAVYIERLQRLPHSIEMPFNSLVRQYIEMYAVRKPQLVEKMLGMSLYYMPIFEEALDRNGLPLELKYLPIVESALDPNAVSKAGAVGLWQFMPSTATGEGLEVNTIVDERRDPIASSEAAAKYLKKLHDIYGDWTLAIAAYNCGPGNVNKAIKRAGDNTRDFWEIYPFLPQETRGYIPAFIAANYIMNYYGAHGISPALARRPLVTDTVHVSSRVHFNQISDVLGISVDALRMLNPQYREDVIPGNIRPYALILPSLQAFCYVANEDSILAHDPERYARRTVAVPSDGSSVKGVDENGAYVEEVSYTTHVVKRGETLKSIAAKYGVTVDAVRTANNLKTTKLHRNQKLKIPKVQRIYTGNGTADPETPSPVVADTITSPSDSAVNAPVVTPEPKQPKQPTKTVTTPKQTTYVVKKGDSLFKIAKAHGTTVDKIKAANNLKSDNIQAGQKLKIPSK